MTAISSDVHRSYHGRARLPSPSRTAARSPRSLTEVGCVVSWRTTGAVYLIERVLLPTFKAGY